MSLSQQKITIGLSAKGTPDNQGVSGKATIGNRNIEDNTFEGDRTRLYPLSDITYAFSVTSAAISNVATLTLTSGAVAQTTGSPVIVGAQVDFEGDALGTPAKLCGFRIRTKSTNTGTVAVAGSNSGALPAITLPAGADIVLSHIAAGQTVTGTVTFTFSAASDVVWVEALAID
jgi:hypothetical protein